MNVIQTFEFEASGERTEQPPFVSSNLFHITVNQHE